MPEQTFIPICLRVKVLSDPEYCESIDGAACGYLLKPSETTKYAWCMLHRMPLASDSSSDLKRIGKAATCRWAVDGKPVDRLLDLLRLVLDER